MNQKFWSAWKWKNLTWRWGNMQWRGCKVTQPACYITVEVPVQHEYAKIHEKLRKVQEGLLRLRPLPSTVLRPWLRLLSTHCKCLGHKRLPNMLWCMLCKSSSIWAPLFHYTYTWGCHKPDNSCCLNLLSHLDSVREKLPRKYIDPPWPIFFVHSSLKGWVSPASVKDANTLGTQTFLKDAQQQICETEDLLLVVFQRCPLRWPISCIKAWP